MIFPTTNSKQLGLAALILAATAAGCSASDTTVRSDSSQRSSPARVEAPAVTVSYDSAASIDTTLFQDTAQSATLPDTIAAYAYPWDFIARSRDAIKNARLPLVIDVENIFSKEAWQRIYCTDERVRRMFINSHLANLLYDQITDLNLDNGELKSVAFVDKYLTMTIIMPINEQCPHGLISTWLKISEQDINYLNCLNRH